MSKTTATPALENDPDLDLRFGEEGILRPETTQQGDVRAILLHDGDSFSLAMTLEDGRYQYDRASADGRPIAGFAATVKQFAPDATFYPTRLLHQADKIIMLGTVKDNNNVSRPGITRFNASGTPDLVFGHVTPGAPPAEATTPRFEYKQADGCVQKNDQKILIAFAYKTGVDNSSEFVSQLTRLEVDGKEDTTFGDAGSIDLKFGEGHTYAPLVQLQGDKIIVAGCHIEASRRELMLARYDMDGSLDKSFGNEGFARMDSAVDALPNWLGEHEGKLWVGGHETGTERRALLTRFDADGHPDVSFNGGQPLLTVNEHSFEGWRVGIAQDDGGIIVLGSTTATEQDEKIIKEIKRTPSPSHVIQRFTHDGKPDLSREWTEKTGYVTDAAMQTSTRLIVAVKYWLLPEPKDYPKVLGVLTGPNKSRS